MEANIMTTYKPRLIEGVTVTPRHKWSASYARQVREVLRVDRHFPTFEAERAEIEACALQWATWAAQKRGIKLPSPYMVQFDWQAVREWTDLGDKGKDYQRPYTCGCWHQWSTTCKEHGAPLTTWRPRHRAEMRIRAVWFHEQGERVETSWGQRERFGRGELRVKMELPGWDQARDEPVGIICAPYKCSAAYEPETEATETQLAA